MAPTLTLSQSQHDPSAMLELVRGHIDKTIVRQISTALEKDSSIDLERVLDDALASYRRRLASAINTAQTRALQQACPPLCPPPPAKRLSFLQTSSPSSIPSIVHALSPSVTGLLAGDTPFPDIPLLLRNTLPRLLEDGKDLYSTPVRAAVQISPEIVVKCGLRVGLEEHSMLDYVSRHTSIPVPKPLGAVTMGDVHYLFLSFIPGEPLEDRWPRLDPDQKASIRSQLDRMLSELRSIPHIPSLPLGTLSHPHICKDCRMTLATSAPSLRTVAQFHDFLVSRPSPSIAPSYVRWLRTTLRDDYRIVLTHGDLHMGNIMVADDAECAGGVRVTGLIDWEMGGWYPEYWEMYKALNLRGADDDSDWWDSFPESIRGYDAEVVERRLVERAMKS